MASEIEKDRQALLQQLNNLGRALEQQSPARASELNEQLRRVVERLAAWLAEHPCGPKGT